MQIYRFIFLLIGFVPISLSLIAQENRDTATMKYTLQDCIDISLKHNLVLQQFVIDEQSTDREVKASLAGWYPQISAMYNVQRYFKLPVSIVPDFSDLSSQRRIPVTFGVANNSNALIQADQVLYSNELLLASKASRFARMQSKQNSEEAKINTVVAVSKAYYDILLTQAQLSILDEAIKRQQNQLQDAFSQFENGTADETDYQRATIGLNNILSDRRRVEESILPKKTYLKELIGYQPDEELLLNDDVGQMEGNLLIDTLEEVNYTGRIEYQLLQTKKGLLNLNADYYKWSFLPTISAFVNYNLVYQSKESSRLYERAYPTSLIGLSTTLPIFTGTRRIQNLRKAQLLSKRAEVEMAYTKQRIDTEHKQAMANYKSALYEWQTVRNNRQVTERVYTLTKLQYEEGIKTYLELIIAESDLRTTGLNYYNTLYRVLSSKLDLQKALGTVTIN